MTDETNNGPVFGSNKAVFGNDNQTTDTTPSTEDTPVTTDESVTTDTPLLTKRKGILISLHQSKKNILLQKKLLLKKRSQLTPNKKPRRINSILMS